MRHLPWIGLTLALSACLASCASAPAAAPVSAGYIRTYDAGLRTSPAAYGAWTVYCDSIQQDMERFYQSSPDGRYETSFDVEYAARVSLIDAYVERWRAGDHEPGPSDAYLQELRAIRSAGYLRQYVFFELDPGDWIAPHDLEENDYFSWMKDHHPDHTPRTLGIVQRTSVHGSPAMTVREAEMPPWSGFERRMLELSFISYAGFWFTDASRVEDAVSGLMARMLPRQEIVWGPAVHQPSGGGAYAQPSDAEELICRDADTGEYSVVFRGTNPVSPAEWLLQDFQIQRQVPWMQLLVGSAPADALISEGTATAVKLRCALHPADGVKGHESNLIEALVGILERSEGRCVVHFTGHSLGGVLAPVMALWFADYLAATGRDDLARKLDLDVCGFAAPTAGNQAFNAYCGLRLQKCARYANDLDIATLAWDEATLSRLPSLYRPDIGMQPITASMYKASMDLARAMDYAQPGGRVTVPSRVVPARGGLYLLEAIYQHSMPYLDMLLPQRKAMILSEVFQPLSRLVVVKGLKPIDLMSLFPDEP
jgi:hypothetical protein